MWVNKVAFAITHREMGNCKHSLQELELQCDGCLPLYTRRAMGAQMQMGLISL